MGRDKARRADIDRKQFLCMQAIYKRVAGGTSEEVKRELELQFISPGEPWRFLKGKSNKGDFV